MTNLEYAELLDYISERSNELKNVFVYRVHSSYNPKNNQICKVTLKINYTKDGSALPKEYAKLPKNVVQRSIAFRGDDCNKENITTWFDNFMKEKSELL